MPLLLVLFAIVPSRAIRPLPQNGNEAFSFLTSLLCALIAKTPPEEGVARPLRCTAVRNVSDIHGAVTGPMRTLHNSEMGHGMGDARTGQPGSSEISRPAVTHGAHTAR